MSRKSRRARRKAKHDARRRQQLDRENAQLAGDVPTLPAGALRPEAVDPRAQADGGASQLPKLIQQAVRQGWATPEVRKPDLVDELMRMLGDPDVPDKVKVAAFNALRMADAAQYERDHPEVAQAAKGRAGTVNINVVQANIEAAAVIRGAIERGELGTIEEVRAPGEPSSPGAG